MRESTSREKVLKKIRDASLSGKQSSPTDIDLDSPLFPKTDETLDVLFAENLNKNGGNFVFCENLEEFLNTFHLLIKSNSWKNIFVQDNTLMELLEAGEIPYLKNDDQLADSKIGLIRCEYLISRNGSVMVSTGLGTGRKLHFMPETLLVFAFSSQLVLDVKDSLKKIKAKYKKDYPSMTTMITGPSKITLPDFSYQKGMFGPKELYVFLVEDYN